MFETPVVSGLVSVIVPVLDTECFLAEALDSHLEILRLLRASVARKQRLTARGQAGLNHHAG